MTASARHRSSSSSPRRAPRQERFASPEVVLDDSQVTPRRRRSCSSWRDRSLCRGCTDRGVDDAAGSSRRSPRCSRRRGAPGGTEGSGIDPPTGRVLGLQHQRVGDRHAVAPAVEVEHLCDGAGRRDVAASSRANGTSSSWATTWFTRPSRSASSASTKLPVIDISAALRTPTARGSSAVRPTRRRHRAGRACRRSVPAPTPRRTCSSTRSRARR